jgi:hypothetical protein
MTSKSEKNPSANPKLILPMGRGHLGKSFFARWMIDRAQAAGREIVVADADRTNPALASYFEGVLTPPSANAADMVDWFLALLDKQAEQRFNMIIDVGGGDQLIKAIARQLDFAEFSERFGIDIVSAYLLSTDLDDLAFMRDLEADPFFKSKVSLIILNEGRINADLSFETAFNAILNHEIFIEAVKRGGKMIPMPRLRPANDLILQRLTMSAADAGQSKSGFPPLGPSKRQFIRKWLRDMELNFGPVAHWLP